MECAISCTTDETDEDSTLGANACEGTFHRGSRSCAKSIKARRCDPLPRPAKWKIMDASIGVNREYLVLVAQWFRKSLWSMRPSFDFAVASRMMLRSRQRAGRGRTRAGRTARPCPSLRAKGCTVVHCHAKDQLDVPTSDDIVERVHFGVRDAAAWGQRAERREPLDDSVRLWSLS